ncbi:hypothetical protein [Acinetobacter baumannii]|uniref:hypothetical protein n=1 Tax=Acinetobacter baumannii TaxID=470 RepID=UPI000968D535|nr:hypothetical protein [Acinetobacter baumannii]MCY2897979.1 hypothetical protein [Acinetobacter baumannii]OLV43217.1 hypothetical protein BS576_19170 [Acinetobacter baumannii]OLV77399.1 hypothetical protein BS582_04100 [Acinetobacter baumannii]
MDKKALLEQFKAEVEASGTSLTHILKMCEFDEVSNDFRSDTIHDYSIGCLNGAWWMFQRQQAKVEELQQENLRLAYGNTSYYNQAVKQNEIIDELQKRVDKALELMQKPVIVGEPAKYVCARFKEIEQALKGDQYDEHRKKAEEAISKGASLTNHRIEL